MQCIDLGGEELNLDATPRQVAKNIEIFLYKQMNLKKWMYTKKKI
jgi:hypothetical protein